jgi:hypothetical protein
MRKHVVSKDSALKDTIPKSRAGSKKKQELVVAP